MGACVDVRLVELEEASPRKASRLLFIGGPLLASAADVNRMSLRLPRRRFPIGAACFAGSTKI
jgi:hypothetical protein|tara:strand:- start:2807 stop:2995 length:189 start_codon:yes stop_codon:yes gene_type:complete